MKRDLELVKQLLLIVERHEQAWIYGNPEVDGFTSEQIAYHIELLCEAGLLQSDFKQREQMLTGDPDGRRDLQDYKNRRGNRDMFRLTWTGHEFLEMSRNERFWNKAKTAVQQATGGLAIDLVRMHLLEMSKRMLKL
jgi:hypothetical protein